MENVTAQFLYDLNRSGPKKVINWCMEVGLISSVARCRVCGKFMTLKTRHDSNSGCMWLCRKAGPMAHRVTKSVRDGSMFQGSRISCIEILLIVYFWIFKLPVMFMGHEIKVGASTLSDWQCFCREVCIQYWMKNNVMIGGKGIIVEVEDSVLNCVFNRGKIRSGQCVYRGVEKGTFRSFIKIVENCDKNAFIDAIKEFIKPGSIVLSNYWTKLDPKKDKEFVKISKKYSMQFEIPNTCHKSIWDKVKSKLSRYAIQSPEQEDSYLAEWIWRRLNGKKSVKERIVSFFQCIPEVYPVEKYEDYISEQHRDHDYISNPYVALSRTDETSSIMESETSSIIEPVIHSILETVTPSIIEPETPSVMEPVTPSVMEPETFSIKEPETSSIKEPESLGIKRPKTLIIKRPEVFIIRKPETLGSKKPETLCIKKPETLCIKKPETLCIKKPETFCIMKPETLCIKKPETFCLKKPETFCLKKPETFCIKKPETFCIKKPETLGIKKPETPSIKKFVRKMNKERSVLVYNNGKLERRFLTT